MSLTRRTLTPPAMESRRRNARLSSGPRTEAGKRRASRNAFQGGPVRAAPLPTLAALDENPADFQQLVAKLLGAYRAANAAERLLIEDIATLRLRKQRNQQAQDGLILRNLGKLQREREERQQELALESSNDPSCLAAAMGLFPMEDSPAKFKELTRLFRIMQEDVEVGMFCADGQKLLQMIYGPNPSVRAARILGHYRELLSAGFTPSPEVGPSAQPRSLPRPPAAGEAEAAGPRVAHPPGSSGRDRQARARLQATQAELLRALEEEKTLLGQRYQRYLQERLPSALAVRRAALVPGEADWSKLARQEQLIDQQIENKTRLLLFTQWVRRSTKRGPRIPNNKEKTKLVSAEPTTG